MPRFSEWAAEQRSAGSAQPQNVGAVATGPQRFLVDNSLLRSDSSGLRYRFSPDGDKNRALKPVAWGRCVWGVLNDTQTWLKVKAGRYLPVTVQGCSVLKLQLDDPEPFEEEVEEILWITPLKSLIGPGSCYEIAAEKAALRRGPSFNAATIIWLSQGEAVQLFGWDESWRWRQCLEPRKRLVGWLLLAREGDDALVQPQALTAPWRPEPLCDAAAEGRLPDLRRYLHELPITWPRDEQGRTPLQLSVLHQHLPCAVRLLEAGADAEEALRECEQRDDEIDELCSALLGAFAGAESDESRLQSALKSLDPAERNVARTQLARLQGTKSEDGIDNDPDAASASTETAEGESKLGEELAASSCLYEASEASESSEKEASRRQMAQRKKRRSRRASFSGRGQLAASSRASSPSVSDSEVEVKTAEAFRNWLEDRPSMFRLSAVRCVDTGIAWDFPLTKSEKRELLLMYVAQGEKMAEESACQAMDQERRQRKSLESARAALARMRKKTCRRSKPGRRSLGGVNF